eukprot:Protomagalhaensia_wolfi_Nauph_80__4020@NODE_4080_length_644_cov_3_140496_g3234_i0_p1_GENE_NODE_4080_length_644_cov_3_140496_g3234_i0NODE_4080_length_644_cov_3_140496_g3234_i0_p1_ORF_typecomplete_len109_score10_30SAC3_GANP/PF03399_16/8_3e07CSN8_PSD8_EIF3K/PF10075_9/0_04_NODE_4080_length_644_cov_3_140496_g3234_i0284610
MEIIENVTASVWEQHNHFLGLPFMCRTLLRVATPRFRMAFVCILSKSHYTIPMQDISQWLAIDDVQECKDFLISQKAVLDSDGILDCRKSYPLFLQSNLLSKKVKAMG